MKGFLSKPHQLLRFVAKRLREERGLRRLLQDIANLVRGNGIAGLFREIAVIGNAVQSPLRRDSAYPAWIARHDYDDERDGPALRRAIADASGASAGAVEGDMQPLPFLSILVDLGHERPERTGDVERTIAALETQHYLKFELLVFSKTGIGEAVAARFSSIMHRHSWFQLVTGGAADFTDAANRAVKAARGDHLLFLRPGDGLGPNALAEIALAASRHRDASFLYWDTDRIGPDGRRRQPCFRPDWNRELFLSQDYIDGAALIPRGLFLTIGGFRQGFGDHTLYELLLRALCAPGRHEPHHIARILCHRAEPADDPDLSPERAKSSTQLLAVQAYCERMLPFVRAELAAHGITRLRYPLPAALPLVSVLIPTRDRLDLLRQAVNGLLQRTDYPAMEILIADNDSREPETLAYLSHLEDSRSARVIRHPGAFNFSALINRAASAANGDFFCLLNNDVDVIHADWLGEMVSRAAAPDIGAVGAKLLYADQRIQHAGVVLGIKGTAGHVFKFLKRHDAGYQKRLQSVQQWLAVTAACLVVSREKFIAVGGFDETDLAVTFNDVDFCLKLHQAGYRNLYTPYAELYHLESVSRGSDAATEKRDRAHRERDVIRARWAAYIANDPFYSPNLSRASDNFALRE